MIWQVMYASGSLIFMGPNIIKIARRKTQKDRTKGDSELFGVVDGIQDQAAIEYIIGMHYHPTG
jgi:hypothetical protein